MERSSNIIIDQDLPHKLWEGKRMIRFKIKEGHLGRSLLKRLRSNKCSKCGHRFKEGEVVYRTTSNHGRAGYYYCSNCYEKICV